MEVHHYQVWPGYHPSSSRNAPGGVVEQASRLVRRTTSCWPQQLESITISRDTVLEAESGIMLREEQELIASHMRSPKNGGNAVVQLLMGGGESSTIVPILAAYLTDKEK